MPTTAPLPDRSAYPALPANTVTYDEFLRRSTTSGTLKVQASRAHGALPTAGVRIRIISRFSDARVLFFDGVTDGDGIIEGILLPAPPAAASLNAETARRGALYQVFANHPAFEPNVYELEIFDGVNAILPVALQLQQEVM